MPFPNIDPVLIEIGPFAIRWYALAYIAGLVLGWRYVIHLVSTERLWQSEPPSLAESDGSGCSLNRLTPPRHPNRRHRSGRKTSPGVLVPAPTLPALSRPRDSNTFLWSERVDEWLLSISPLRVRFCRR